MNTGNIKFFGIAILLWLGVVVSCTRNIAVSPVSPIATNTPANTNTFTNTPTFTNTVTSTNTLTFTNTNTPNGPTNTFTNTFTVTNTPTATNTSTNTFTFTMTPTATTNPNSIIDYETGMTDNTNFGLTGSTYSVLSGGASPSSGTTAILSGGTGCSAGKYVSIGGTVGTTAPTFAQLQTDFLASTAMYNINTQAPGMNAFIFCIKSNTLSQIWFMVSDASTTQSSANAGVVVPVTSSWQSVTVCFNHMQSPNWAPASISGHLFDPTQAFSAAWQVTTSGAPYDIEIDNFQFANVSCPAFTATPTIDPLLIDDFESGGASNTQIDPGPGGTWNGSWFTANDGSSAMSPVTGAWAKTASPGNGSAYAAHVTCGPVTQNASFGVNFMATPAPYNLSAYTGVVFDVKADVGSGTEMALAFPDSDTQPTAQGGTCAVSCNGYHQANFCMSTSWQSVTVFFDRLAQPSWAPPVAFNKSQVIGLAFAFPVSQNMGVWVDNIKLTTTADPNPPASAPATLISDFDFNSGGTGINPNLTNYVANPIGFACYPPVSCGPASLLGPIVQCNGFSAPFASRVNGVYTDQANSCYPSMQLQLNLFSNSGGVTTYYNLPSGLTGIKFEWKVAQNTTTGGTPSSYYLHYNNANIDGTAAQGKCTSGCWDDFIVTLPVSATWGLQTVPFANMTRGGWGNPIPADPCQVGTPYNFPYSGGCYNSTTMGFSWASQSGNTAGTYTVDFSVDDVTFY